MSATDICLKFKPLVAPLRLRTVGMGIKACSYLSCLTVLDDLKGTVRVVGLIDEETTFKKKKKVRDRMP